MDCVLTDGSFCQIKMAMYLVVGVGIKCVLTVRMGGFTFMADGLERQTWRTFGITLSRRIDGILSATILESKHLNMIMLVCNVLTCRPF